MHCIELVEFLLNDEFEEVKCLYSTRIFSYEAAQVRTERTPVTYLPEGGNIYLKQIKDFTSRLEWGELDYSFTECAVQVQRVVDEICKE